MISLERVLDPAGIGKKDDPTSADILAQEQAAIARELFDQSRPLRDALSVRSLDFFNNPGTNAASRALKGRVETNFGTARDRIISDVPQGGPLLSLLALNETGKARTLTEGSAAIERDELARALTLGTGLTQQGVSGFGSASQIQAFLSAQNTSRQTEGLTAAGTGFGAFLGGK